MKTLTYYKITDGRGGKPEGEFVGFATKEVADQAKQYLRTETNICICETAKELNDYNRSKKVQNILNALSGSEVGILKEMLAQKGE